MRLRPGTCWSSRRCAGRARGRRATRTPPTGRRSGSPRSLRAWTGSPSSPSWRSPGRGGRADRPVPPVGRRRPGLPAAARHQRGARQRRPGRPRPLALLRPVGRGAARDGDGADRARRARRLPAARLRLRGPRRGQPARAADRRPAGPGRARAGAAAEGRRELFAVVGEDATVRAGLGVEWAGQPASAWCRTPRTRRARRSVRCWRRSATRDRARFRPVLGHWPVAQTVPFPEPGQVAAGQAARLATVPGGCGSGWWSCGGPRGTATGCRRRRSRS
ncbi:hypothetical protein NKH77_40080 [Streptomyces sp. M19]